MRRTMLKSKIHRATTTGGDLHYNGSVTVDPILLEAADIVAYERVEVYNITNGERFATYAIEGEPGQGELIFNGAAAHKAHKGDLVIVCSYAEYEESEAKSHKGTVVLVDEKNHIAQTTSATTAKELEAVG
ncbi:MAG: aspartate 1-decarboxylase [Acidobacteriota bacterium]